MQDMGRDTFLVGLEADFRREPAVFVVMDTGDKGEDVLFFPIELPTCA